MNIQRRARAICHPHRFATKDGRCRRCVVDSMAPKALARIQAKIAQSQRPEPCHCETPAPYPDDGMTACRLCSRVIPEWKLERSYA